MISHLLIASPLPIPAHQAREFKSQSSLFVLNMKWKMGGTKLEVLAGRCHSSEVRSEGWLCECQRFSFSFLCHGKLGCLERERERNWDAERVQILTMGLGLPTSGSPPLLLIMALYRTCFPGVSEAQLKKFLCYASKVFANGPNTYPLQFTAPCSTWAALSVFT